MSEGIELRQVAEEDREEIAELIYLSLNTWYQSHAMPPIFAGASSQADVFYQVYSQMEGSTAVVAADHSAGRLAGICFYHTRPTHMSLGIMTVHPDYFGQGVARCLLKWITDIADEVSKPVRLVSSALNLDSFSLYTRAGFVPRRTFQDLQLEVPSQGLPVGRPSPAVRPADAVDVEAMEALESELSGISRASDFHYFLQNAAGFWHTSVCTRPDGTLGGFLTSSGSMLGPGVAVDEATAEALLLAELDRRRGTSVVFLIPVECGDLVQQAYGWGGRNCELHVAQVRGDSPPMRGVTLPTFMPETG